MFAGARHGVGWSQSLYLTVAVLMFVWEHTGKVHEPEKAHSAGLSDNIARKVARADLVKASSWETKC